MKKITTLVGFVAIISMFVFVVAPTMPVAFGADYDQEATRERRAQIKLQKEVDELVEQMNTLQAQAQGQNGDMSAMDSMMNSTAVPTQIDYTFTTNLTLGNSGKDVTALQQFLISKGYLKKSMDEALSQFDNSTRSALIRYQKDNGVTPASGILGPVTREKINAELENQAPYGLVTITSPMRGDRWLSDAPQTITWLTNGNVEDISIGIAEIADEDCLDQDMSTTTAAMCPDVDPTIHSIVDRIPNTGIYQWESASSTLLGLDKNYEVLVTGYGTNDRGEEVSVAEARSGAITMSTSTSPRLTTSGNLTDARVGSWYSQIINTEDFKHLLRWSVASGTLPVGLSVGKNSTFCNGGSMNCTQETFQGIVTGVPQKPGTYEFVLSATDGAETARKRFVLIVRP